jgi:hypothetical protein
VFSVLGLVFDIVGAVALVLGLFGHSEPLTPGFRRPPTAYAHDAAFAVVGASFLSLGFLLQALQYLGVHHNQRHWVTALVAVVALAILAPSAVVAYGLLYIAFHAVEARRVAQLYPDITYNVTRRRRGVRFWLQEAADEGTTQQQLLATSPHPPADRAPPSAPDD